MNIELHRETGNQATSVSNTPDIHGGLQWLSSVNDIRQQELSKDNQLLEFIHGYR